MVALLLPILSLLLLTTTPLSHSAATCSSTTPTLSNSKLFKKCNSLPTLGATLHWSYTAANKTLSVAFTAVPPSKDGWVAWGINPTGTGMPGTQAILAFKQANGKMAVKTYNLSSYSDIIEGKLAFEVYEHRAEFNAGDGSITIYAAVASGGGKANQVWQVGKGVTNGFPDKHSFDKANLESKETLDLSSGAAEESSPASSDGGGALLRKKNVGSLILGLVFGLISVVDWW